MVPVGQRGHPVIQNVPLVIEAAQPDLGDLVARELVLLGPDALEARELLLVAGLLRLDTSHVVGVRDIFLEVGPLYALAGLLLLAVVQRDRVHLRPEPDHLGPNLAIALVFKLPDDFLVRVIFKLFREVAVEITHIIVLRIRLHILVEVLGLNFVH